MEAMLKDCNHNWGELRQFVKADDILHGMYCDKCYGFRRLRGDCQEDDPDGKAASYDELTYPEPGWFKDYTGVGPDLVKRGRVNVADYLYDQQQGCDGKGMVYDIIPDHYGTEQ
jgi:hypothetical protein